MQFGERLASERKRLGYRGADFASACGVTGASQSLYENDKRYPDAEYLMKACALGADPAFLLIGTPSPAGALAVSEAEKGPLVAFHGLSPKARAAMMALVEVVKDGG
ncbi:MAG: hypothetical protein RL490_1450 [Pseudomonadota bacterium]|jgi:transcriptional regulator with XRE-family HTH domain